MVSNSTGERSFSKLKLVNNYLRNCSHRKNIRISIISIGVKFIKRN